jgi:hypothetical protein
MEVVKGKVGKNESLDPAEGNLSPKAPVRQGYHLFAEKLVEAIRASDEHRGAEEENGQRREAEKDPAKDPERATHQKNCPMLKWIRHEESPGGGSRGNPTSRRIGPTGVAK